MDEKRIAELERRLLNAEKVIVGMFSLLDKIAAPPEFFEQSETLLAVYFYHYNSMSNEEKEKLLSPPFVPSEE